MKLLNLGCGNHLHPAWINMDVAPMSPGVIPCDLSGDIPLPDASCDAVYQSNLIEHLRRRDASKLMKECFRVLKPGGILRVATPDLETICRIYLEKLQAALKQDAAGVADYEWIMLEMYDQTVREHSGGDMLTYLARDPLPNPEFVYDRIGEEGRRLVKSIRAQKGAESNPTEAVRPAANVLTKISSLITRFLRRLPQSHGLSDQDAIALGIGRFRLSGEVHQWMYDRYSLSLLMIGAGFHETVLQSAAKSLIPNWSSFGLDIIADGTVRKPDSFFMEAVRPTE